MAAENESSYFTSEVSLPRSIRFWLLLIFEIPSLACSIFLLYHFIMDSNTRSALKNHTIICLNIAGFIFLCIDVPLYLNFIRFDQVWPSTPAHCLLWWLVDYGVFFACCLLTAWASIERHILIFHNSWLNSTKGRILAHYFPLITIIVYLIGFYTWIIFFPPCINVYQYDLPVCGASPCHTQDQIIGTWEVGFHSCVSNSIIVLFNIGLVIRVILEKRAREQPIVWRKHRKMTVQMLTISSVFIIFNLPVTIMFMARYAGLPSDIGVEAQLYFFFLTYWVPFSLPFVSLNSLPNIKQKLFKLCTKPPQHQSTVAAMTYN